MSDLPPERKFLHDIATPIAVIRLSLKKVSKDLSTKEQPAETAMILTTLERALRALDQLESLHAEHKEFISKAA